MERNRTLSSRIHTLGLMLFIMAAADGTVRAANGKSFIGKLNTVTVVSTTMPANNDVHPYGVAQVPRSKGNLVAGRFLISNFNNAANVQGTGTTIVQIAADGTFSLFAQIDASKVSCPGGI